MRFFLPLYYYTYVDYTFSKTYVLHLPIYSRTYLERLNIICHIIQHLKKTTQGCQPEYSV